MKDLIAFYLVIILFISCKKENNGDERIPVEYNTTLSFEADITYADTCQLVISDQKGNSLLDTLLCMDQSHLLIYVSTTEKVNLTVIYPTGYDIKVVTYVDVVPGNWKVSTNNNFVPLNEGPSPDGTLVESRIIYKNLPPDFNGEYFFNSRSVSITQSIGYGHDSLEIVYQHLAVPHFVYLVLPGIGQFHLTKVLGDTCINLTQMHDVHQINLSTNLDYPVDLTSIWLICFPDKYDLNNWVSATELFTDPADQLYPSEGIDLYSCYYEWYDENDNYYVNHIIKDVIPSENILINRNSIELSDSSFTHFHVNFPQDLPTLYYVNLASRDVDWYCYLPPEKNT